MPSNRGHAVIYMPVYVLVLCTVTSYSAILAAAPLLRGRLEDGAGVQFPPMITYHECSLQESRRGRNIGGRPTSALLQWTWPSRSGNALNPIPSMLTSIVDYRVPEFFKLSSTPFSASISDSSAVGTSHCDEMPWKRAFKKGTKLVIVRMYTETTIDYEPRLL